MADDKETAQRKEKGKPLPQAPSRRENGRRVSKGHMAVGGETVSHHIVSGLTKRQRRELFGFKRQAWWNRGGAR